MSLHAGTGGCRTQWDDCTFCRSSHQCTCKPCRQNMCRARSCSLHTAGAGAAAAAASGPRRSQSLRKPAAPLATGPRGSSRCPAPAPPSRRCCPAVPRCPQRAQGTTRVETAGSPTCPSFSPLCLATASRPSSQLELSVRVRWAAAAHTGRTAELTVQSPRTAHPLGGPYAGVARASLNELREVSQPRPRRL